MDQHGTHLGAESQEIRCVDCGNRFMSVSWQKSARCPACGNIQVLVASPTTRPASKLAPGQPASDLTAARSLLKSALLGVEEPAPEPILKRFYSTPDSARVREILTQYQVEWQIWAMLVKRFDDPAFHSAYLTHIISRGAFDRAGERYREHRNVMAMGRDSQWQAEVADLMLERIEKLSVMRMQMEGGGGIILPYWLLTLPLNRGIFRVAWIALGLVLAFKILGLV